MNCYKQVYGNNCGCNQMQERVVSNCNNCNSMMRSSCDDCSSGSNRNCNGVCDVQSYRNWDGCDEKFPIGMAYVPWQKFEELFSAEEGYCNGTIFKQLDLDFYGRSCR